MKNQKDYFIIENVWKKITPDVQKQVILFWENNSVPLTQNEAETRSQEIVFIAKNLKDDIIAVCSVKRIFIKNMNNYFYYFRTMVDPLYRRLGIAVRFTLETRNFFNQQFIDGKDRSCIGMYIVAESELLNLNIRQAVWPRTGFVFVGFNQKGQQMRVFYFQGAEI
ncbi:hypothetical protein MHK_010664 [Candidatus Magnetomorum sp. HK-1]|nr:hypothetical protein MHK_010664 [Candidatus Magnetomorum sp. HK-1]